MEASSDFWGEGQPEIKVDPVRDALFNYDADAQKAVSAQRPWATDPSYFKSVRVSAIALIKMVMHARSGGSLEVMGLMQGYVDGTALVITDAFRLPVEGTETRVNAQDEANEYLVEYLKLSREQGRMENAIGWYHSHPGYGCWLSGIDVSTQAMQQSFNDPFVAIVIDPDRTISAGKVEIGAFRTYPPDYKPPLEGATTSDGFQSVPLNKADDFGAHASRYYSLEVEHFKSSLDAQLLDLLWNKYWVQTLSQSPLLTNKDYDSKQILDLGQKIKEIAATIQRGSRNGGQAGGNGGGSAFGGGLMARKAAEQAFERIGRDSKMLAARERSGLMASSIKASVFDASQNAPGGAASQSTTE
ncbi:cop9 signalosome complex subunit 5 [Ophiostoma piceae UAMH 11346]|uniref:COP9 signalosome complex subunit 5 n=1 Tax=Ophiostoma piceae (strain UAMH 11346) TaxID=1262450 RepID=S3CUA8_OPHP1|nr:cop9 signalosome complex subunit 5 [Ophiostoma piceae UAMH 11346]